jgi:hypothetical protein
MAKGNQTLAAIDRCLIRTPDMKILENVYEVVCESRLIYGAEIWGLEDGWKEIYVIQGRLCKKVLRIPKPAANGIAKLEMGRDNRRGKVLCLAVKYWPRILHMDRD